MRTSLILNGRAQTGWDARQIAEHVDLPVVVDLPEQRWLRRSEEWDEAYELLRSRRGTAVIGQLLSAVEAVSEKVV